MENNLNSDILDKITKTCTCKSISRATIKEAIKMVPILLMKFLKQQELVLEVAMDLDANQKLKI